MNTKTFAVRKKWLIGLLIVVLLFFGYITYLRSMKNYSTWTFYCAGRRVSAQSLINSNQTLFSITVNNKPIYMEIDENKDGKTDSIVHLENGVEKFVTWMDKAKKINIARGVIYHSIKGDKYCVTDVGETCLFTQRVWTSSKGEKVKEVLEDGHWIPVRSDNSSPVK